MRIIVEFPEAVEKFQRRRGALLSRGCSPAMAAVLMGRVPEFKLVHLDNA